MLLPSFLRGRELDRPLDNVVVVPARASSFEQAQRVLLQRGLLVRLNQSAVAADASLSHVLQGLLAERG